MTLEAVVSEGAAGAPARQASASESVTVETKRITLSDEGNDAESQCLSFLIAKGLQEQPPFPPDPIGPIAFPPDWQALDAVELATGLKTLFKLNVQNSTLAAGSIDQAAAQLGVLPQTLFHVVKLARVSDRLALATDCPPSALQRDRLGRGPDGALFAADIARQVSFPKAWRWC